MKNLFSAEFYKLSKSLGYKLMLAGSAGVGLFFCYFWISNSNQASGYQMLPIMDSFVMFHTIFTSVFTAVFLCGEFDRRTIELGLFCGLPRRSVFISKLIAYFTGLLCLLSTVVAVPVVIMSIRNGFGIELTADGCMEVLEQVVFFWLVSSAIGGFFIFLTLATKNVVATMGAGMGIAFYMLVWTTAYLSGWGTYVPARYSYVYQMRVLVKYSFVYQMFVLADWEHLDKGLFLGVSLVTLIVTLIASILIFERSELK